MFRGETQLGRVALMGVVLLLAARTAQGDVLPKGTVITDAVIPIHHAAESRPSALIRVDSLRHDYQTRGFFRIGALPAVKAEGVEFEIADAASLRTALEQTGPAVLDKGSRRTFEMRDVTFRLRGESEPRLTAPLIRLHESGDWDLVNGCRLREPGSGDWVSLPRSRLVVSGEAAGSVQSGSDAETRTFHPFLPLLPASNNSRLQGKQ